MSILRSTKILIIEATDLSRDALHIYVGLAVMLAVAILLRRSLADWRPIAAVALASVAGEAWDLFDTFRQGEPPTWSGNWKDIWNTTFWPAILFCLARFTRVLKR